MKISSKREVGDDFEADGYSISAATHSEETLREAEILPSSGGNESGSHSHQPTQRSSEAGSGQLSNQQHHTGIHAPSHHGSVTVSQQGKSTAIPTTNQSQTTPQPASGSQSKGSFSCSHMSSHDTQSSHQLTTSSSPTQVSDSNTSGGASSKQHLQTGETCGEVATTSASSLTVVPVSPSKTNSSNNSQSITMAK